MAILAQRSALKVPGVLGRRRAPAARSSKAVKSSGLECPGLRFETLSDLPAIAALRPEWTALFDAHARPHQVFQTFEWLWTWSRIYLDRRTTLAVVVGRLDGRLVLAWPLVVRRVLGVQILTGMGEPVSQYTDALMAPELGRAGEEAALAYVLASRIDALSLRRVRDDAAIAPLLRGALASRHRSAAPYVSFDGAPDAAAFEARFCGKLRSSRRRRRRRAAEQGSLSFTSCRACPEAAAQVVTALAFKRAWAARRRTLAPTLRDPRFEHFFVAAAVGGKDAPDVRVSALRSGAETVGVEISVACKGQLFGHVLAPNPSSGISGLGGVLAEATILAALDQGFEGVDLLAPADVYKLEWTSTCIGVCDYAVPRTLTGWLYARLWLDLGRAAAKEVVRRAYPALARLRRMGLSKASGKA